jgi:tetratricopeptide (TPR) repeat protein
MAPEAHYGGHIDGRTDIFSLGAVFYEMLTARHPFEGGGFQTVIEHIMNRTPEPASRLNPAVPLSLSTVIERMLARDAASRYASCEEVAAALAEARASANGADVDPAPGRERVGPRGEGSEEKTVPRPRHVLRAVAIAAVGVSAAVAVCLAIWPPPLPRNRVVALLLPTTPGGSPDFASFALGSLELLASRLQRHQDQPGFQLVPLKESRGEQLASVTDARKLLGANLALVSTFDQSGNTLTAHLELREPGRGRLIAQRVIRLPQSKPLVWSDSLYRATLGLLHLPVRRGAHLPALGVRGAGTLEFLATGIGRVQAAASEQDLARARDELETACRMEPEAALPRAWLATAELKTNQQTKDPQWLARAEASARQAIALDKKLGDGHRVLGETLNLLKRPAEALPEFRLACALDPLRDDVWVGYGRSNRLLGDRGAERAVYLAAIERRPNASRPRWWLANWEFQEGHFEAAMAAYRDMIARAPDFSRGYSSLGAMLVQIGEYGRGIDTLHRALALRASSTIYTNLGTAYFNTGHLNECVDAYNQAFQFDASNYLNWLNLGDAYYWLKGQPDQAHDAYLQAVNLGRARLLQGVESGAPPDPVVTAYLATVFPKLAQPDSARAYVARANAIDSSSVSVQYLVALTCWQLGERQRALDWLERAVSGGYPPPWLRDSPVHKEWHTEPRFMALLAHAGMAPRTTKSPENGGGR